MELSASCVCVRSGPLKSDITVACVNFAVIPPVRSVLLSQAAAPYTRVVFVSLNIDQYSSCCTFVRLVYNRFRSCLCFLLTLFSYVSTVCWLVKSPSPLPLDFVWCVSVLNGNFTYPITRSIVELTHRYFMWHFSKLREKRWVYFHTMKTTFKLGAVVIQYCY
jgi:hypothetical protein